MQGEIGRLTMVGLTGEHVRPINQVVRLHRGADTASQTPAPAIFQSARRRLQNLSGPSPLLGGEGAKDNERSYGTHTMRRERRNTEWRGARGFSKG